MKRFLTIVILFSLPALVFAQPRFGMVGVALGVVAYPPDPCLATLGVRDVNGVPLPLPDKTVTLQPGQSAFLDFNANTALTQLGQRIALRPVVTLTQDAGPNACHATAEVFDNFTGFSLVAVSPLTPQPEPEFGMVGIALGQVLRLNGVAYPPDPCNAQLSFVNASGTPQPQPGKIVTLNPGQAAFLDLSFGTREK